MYCAFKRLAVLLTLSILCTGQNLASFEKTREDEKAVKWSDSDRASEA